MNAEIDFGTSSAWDYVNRLSLLMYGDSGTGKTRLWSSAPGKILCFVCSGGSKPGEFKSIKSSERGRITAPVVTSSDQLIDWVGQVKDKGGYDLVGLDHISGFQSLLLKESRGLSDLPLVKRHRDTTFAQYGEANAKAIEILRAMLSLDCDTFYVAQQKFDMPKDDPRSILEFSSDAIRPKVVPDMTPEVLKWFKNSVDYAVQTLKRQKMVSRTEEVAGTEITVTERSDVPGDKIEFCARTEPHDTVWTKFRMADDGIYIPDFVVNPTWTKLKDIINGKYPKPKSTNK